MADLHSKCLVCKAALQSAQRLSGLCGRPECQRKHLLNEAREALRYWNETIRKRFLELRAQTAVAAGVDQPERYPLAIIPSFANGLVPLTEKRRQAFRENITKVIHDAWEMQADDLLPPQITPRAEVQRFFGSACALCRGYCCRLAGDHAFFRPETVYRFRQAHPDMSQEEVIEAYMLHLRDQSLENSCVYHGEHGCILPRDMRPGICNEFYCEGLWNVMGELNAEALRGFFVQANGTYLAGAAFLDGNQTTKVDVSVGFVSLS